MTASMIARLVEDGQLRWTDTIGDAFDGMELNSAYSERTLLEVLQHRAGIPAVETPGRATPTLIFLKTHSLQVLQATVSRF